MISETDDGESILCNIKNSLKKKDLLLVQIKLNNKLLGEYSVSKEGIMGSIIIKKGINMLDIKNSYETVVFKKIKNFWKGKLNILDIFVKYIS